MSNTLIPTTIIFLLYVIILTPIELLTHKLVNNYKEGKVSKNIAKLIFSALDFIAILLLVLINIADRGIIDLIENPARYGYLLVIIASVLILIPLRLLMLSILKNNQKYLKYISRMYFLAMNIIFVGLLLLFSYTLISGQFLYGEGGPAPCCVNPDLLIPINTENLPTQG